MKKKLKNVRVKTKKESSGGIMIVLLCITQRNAPRDCVVYTLNILALVLPLSVSLSK